MNGAGYRGRGFRPRGAHNNNWNGNPFGGPRFRHPGFTPPRPLGSRPVHSDAWIERPPCVPFHHWQQNGALQFQNFPQPNPQFRNKAIMPPFPQNGRGRPPNLRGNRGFFGNPRQVGPPLPGQNDLGKPKLPFVQKGHVSQEPDVQALPGSEEERQQKIAETANRLKQKLSSVTKDDMITFWEDDFSVLKSTSKDEPPSVNSTPEWKNKPDINLTFNDFKDIGRVTVDNSTRLSMKNKDFDKECCVINVDNNIDTNKNTHAVINVSRSMDISNSTKESSQSNECIDLDICDNSESMCNTLEENQGSSNDSVVLTSFKRDQDLEQNTSSMVYENLCTDEPKNDDPLVKNSSATLNLKSRHVADKNATIDICTAKENVLSISYSPKNHTQYNSTSDNNEDVLLLSPTFNPCTPPPTYIPKAKGHDKVPLTCLQKPPPRNFGQEGQFQLQPAFDSQLCLQKRTSLHGQISMNTLTTNPSAVQNTNPTTDFNKPTTATNYSQLTPMVQPSQLGSGIQMSYPPNIAPILQPQVLPYIYSIPPPPKVLSPVFHQDKTFISLSDSDKIQQSDINEGLEDMHNAMKFAEEVMNAASNRDNVNEYSTLEPPLLTANTSAKSSPKVEENIDKSQQPKADTSSDSKARSKKEQKNEFDLDTFTKDNNSIKQNIKSSIGIPLKDDRRRSKVTFNFNSKSTKFVSHKWQKKRNENDKKLKASMLASHPTTRNLAISKKITREGSKSASKYLRHGTTIEKKDKPKIAVNGTQGNRSAVANRPIILQNKTTCEKTQSDLNSKVKQTPRNSSKQNRGTNAQSSELSWKNRVISRFLKMSKSDICNMVNNSSLRKFDIAMKHLVKQKRSSLSLKMRNTEDEKIKSYDRDEFMNQLNAMLDPGAVVDISNLPTEFIHHLSEVLQLDPVPSDHSQTISTPDIMTLNSKSSNQTTSSEGLIIENKNKESVSEAAQPNTLHETSQLVHDVEEKVNFLNATDSVSDLAADDQKMPSSEETQQDLATKKSIPVFNIADLDDIFSEVIAKVNSDQTVDTKRLSTEAKSTCKSSPEKHTTKETMIGIFQEVAAADIKTTAELEFGFSAEIAKTTLNENNETTKRRKKNRLLELSHIGMRRWSNREQDDSVAFRNLTKEEWEAKYGTSACTSNAIPNESNSVELHAAESSQTSKYLPLSVSCSSVSPKSRSEIDVETRHTIKNTFEDITTSCNEQPDLLGIKRLTNSTKDSCSSSSCSSSSSSDSTSDSTSQSSDETSSDITKLLKVIKEKEKIAKTRSLSETMRDEITAEIQRTRQEKKKHRERRLRKRDKKRRDKREKRRKLKKKRRKKTDESDTSNSDSVESEQPLKLLSENEIKQEIVIKEEKNITEQQNTAEPIVKTSSNVYALCSKHEKSRPCEPVRSCADNDHALNQNAEKNASALPVMQLRTKAQLKQMPETSKSNEQTGLSKEMIKSSTSEAETIENTFHKKRAEETTKMILSEEESGKNILSSVSNESHKLLVEEKAVKQDSATENQSENKLLCVQKDQSVEVTKDKSMSTEKVSSSIPQDLQQENIKLSTKNIASKKETQISSKETALKDHFNKDNKKIVDNIADTDKSTKKLDIKTYKERMLQRRMKHQNILAESLKDLSLLTENLLKIPARIAQQETSSDTSQDGIVNIDNNDSSLKMKKKKDDFLRVDSTTKTAQKQDTQMKLQFSEVSQQESVSNVDDLVHGPHDSKNTKHSPLNHQQIRKTREHGVHDPSPKADVISESEAKIKLCPNEFVSNVEKKIDGGEHIIKQNTDSTLNQISKPEEFTVHPSRDLKKFRNIRSEGSKELKLKEKTKNSEKKELSKKRGLNIDNSIDDEVNVTNKQSVSTDIASNEFEWSAKFAKHGIASRIEEKSLKKDAAEISIQMTQEIDKSVKKGADLQVQSNNSEECAVTDKEMKGIDSESDKCTKVSNELDIQKNKTVVITEGLHHTFEMEHEKRDDQKKQDFVSADTGNKELYNSGLNTKIEEKIERHESQISGAIDTKFNGKHEAIKKVNDLALDNSKNEIPQSTNQLISGENTSVLKDNVDHSVSLHSPKDVDSPFKGFAKESISHPHNSQVILENVNTEFDKRSDSDINLKSEVRDESGKSSSNNLVVKISLNSNIRLPYNEMTKNVKKPSQQNSLVSSTEVVKEPDNIASKNLTSAHLKTDTLNKHVSNEVETPDKCVENVTNDETESGMSNDTPLSENHFNEPSQKLASLPAIILDPDECSKKIIANTSTNEAETSHAGEQRELDVNVSKNCLTSSFENCSKSDEDCQSIKNITTKNCLESHVNEEKVNETEKESASDNHVKNVDKTNTERRSNNFTTSNEAVSLVNSNMANEARSDSQILKNPVIQNEQINQINCTLREDKDDSSNVKKDAQNLLQDKTKKTGLHKVTNKPGMKSKYEKKRNISESNLEDGVKSDTLTFGSKESIISRMIQIDVEIHKLMMEKMALYKLLETKTILEDVSPDSSTVPENNKEQVAKVKSPTPTVMSQLIQNIDTDSVSNLQVPFNGNTEPVSKRKSENKGNYSNPSKHKFLKQSVSPKRKRNLPSFESNSDDEKVTRIRETSKSPGFAKKQRSKNEGVIAKKTSGELESEVTAQSKKASKKDMTKSVLKKTSGSSKNVKNDCVGNRSCQQRTEIAVTAKNLGFCAASCGVSDNLIDSTDDVIVPQEEAMSSYDQQAKCSDSTTSLPTSIYSDESTVELPDQETSVKNKLKRKNTGLALLEESFKREIAISKKMKTVARKKKKMQLKTLLDSVNHLTPEEDDLPLNKLYIKKLQQKRNLLVSLHAPSGSSNDAEVTSEYSTQISEHISEIIDAVAENKIQELYQKTNEMNVTDISVERVTSTQVDDVLGSITDKQQFFCSGVENSEKTETDIKALETRIESQQHIAHPLTFEKSTIEKTALPAEVMNDKSGSIQPVENPPKPCDVTNIETEIRISPDASTSQRRTETPSDLNTLVDQINEVFNNENLSGAPILHEKRASINSLEINTDKNLVEDQKLMYADRSVADEGNTKSTKCHSFIDTTTTSLGATELAAAEINADEPISLTTSSKQEGNLDLNNVPNAAECRVTNQSINENDENLKPEEQLHQNQKELSTVTQSETINAAPVSSSQAHRILETSCTDDQAGKQNIVTHRRARSLKFIRRRCRRSKLKRKDMNESLLNVEGTRQKTSKSCIMSNQEKNPRLNFTSISGKLVSLNNVVLENSPSNVKRKLSPLPSPSASKKLLTADEFSKKPAFTVEAQRSSLKRKQQTTLTMMSCKVKLIDSKYTILKPDVNPNALKQLGITTINNFNSEQKFSKEDTPVMKASQGKDSAVASLPLEKATTAQNTPHNCKVLHLTHNTLSNVTAKTDSMIEDDVEQEISEAKMTRTRKLQKTSLTQKTECFASKSPAIVQNNNTPTISHEIPSANQLSTCIEGPEIEVLNEESVKSMERTKHDEESLSCQDLEIVGETNQSRTQYTVHKGPILDIKIFDDSILAASEDGMIYRYNQSSNGILNIYKGHKAAVTCLFIYKGNIANVKKEWMYSGALDGTLRCYDITTGLEVREAAQVGSPVQCMDQAWGIIFIGTKSGHVSRFHIKSNDIRGDTIQFSDKSVLALKATNEGPRKVLIVASRNQPITIRDAQNGLFLRIISGQRSHTVYSLMRDHSLIYCGTSSTSIPVFDFTNGEQVVQYNAGVGIVCMRLYQQLLFAGCYDGNIYVFDTRNHKLICSIPGPGNMLLSMEIVGHKIIAGSKDKRLQSWLMPKQVQALLSRR